jgi:capsule polysaccharide export protein KpsE/RkpR
MDKTLSDLKKHLIIRQTEDGGLGITDVISVSITAFDRNAQRTADMANAAFSLLKKKTTELNRQEYADIVLFLESQLAVCGQHLERSRQALNNFQIANHIYQIPEQVAIVMQAISVQKALLLSLENTKGYLEKTRSHDYGGITEINHKLAIINQKIFELETMERSDVFLGLTQSIGLKDSYIDLYKEAETYVQLRLILRRQIEMARIKQSRKHSSIYLVDSAQPPEHHSKPNRFIAAFSIIVTYLFCLFSFYIIREKGARLPVDEEKRLP